MKDIKFPAIGLVLLFILISVYYFYFIQHAAQLSFAPYGDGYKNYYTLSYYLKYNTGTHFTGMNYPFGENVIYTDNQPAVAWALKGLSCFVPGLTNHLREILLYTIFISIFLSYLFVYRLLFLFDLPPIFAAICSLFICMLAPQMARINGHYSLAYSFYFPLLLLLIVNQLNGLNQWRPIVLLSLLLSIFIFIHPYYFAISAFFLISLLVVHACRSRIWKVLKFLVPVIVSLSLFKTYLFFTDAIVDRPTSPWGFMISRSTLADIFLYPNSFIYQGLHTLGLAKKIVFHWEGQAYIGVICTICLILLALAYAFRKLSFLRINSTALLLLLASIPVLLFAMAFPFSVHVKLEQLLDFMPNTIKQFRAIGRFSWIFYYTASITASLVLYNLIKVSKTKSFAWGIGITAMVIWFIDMNTTNNYWASVMKKWAVPVNEAVEASAIEVKLKEHQLSFDSFQAILPIPYFNNGSEKIYLEAAGAQFEGMKWSLGSGLPLAATMMSRTSISQSLELVNLFSSDYIQKDILDKLPSNKPFLLFKDDQPNVFEQNLLNKAQYLFDTLGTSFYALSPSLLTDSLIQIKKQLPQTISNLFSHSNYFSSSPTPNVVLKQYNDQANPNAVIGTGAYYTEKGDEYIYADTLPNATDSSTYNLSVWFYTDKRVPAYPAMYLTVVDSNGITTYSSDVNGKFSMENFKNWIRVSIDFPLNHAKSKLYVSISGNKRTIDEFMIKPSNLLVVSSTNNNTFFLLNNYPISPKQ